MEETLEEAAERWNEKQTTLEFGKPHNAPSRIKAFVVGAKWQQERSYSEEEVFKLLSESRMYGQLINAIGITKWFEQFKKK